MLVGEDYVMKIADFGMARNMRDANYYRKITDVSKMRRTARHYDIRLAKISFCLVEIYARIGRAWINGKHFVI